MENTLTDLMIFFVCFVLFIGLSFIVVTKNKNENED